jgi:hypothetical protein
MKASIQLFKETKEDGQVGYFIKINGFTKSYHYNFEEAVSSYNLLVEVYQPKTEEVIMEQEIDY